MTSKKIILAIVAVFFALNSWCALAEAGEFSIVNDLFSPLEKRSAGLHKLTSEELKALDNAIMRVFSEINASMQSSSTGLDFYDR